MYDGLNPKADGSSDMDFVPSFRQQVLAEPWAEGVDEPLEAKLDRRLREEAIRFAREHPRRAVELALLKFSRMWNIWPNASEYRSWPLRLAVLVSYAPLLLLGIVGAFRHARRGWPWLWSALPAVYLALLHLVFVSSIRYREPAMLPLAALAAAALVAPRETPPR